MRKKTKPSRPRRPASPKKRKYGGIGDYLTEKVNVSLGAMALPVDAIGIAKDNITGEVVVSISVSMGRLMQNFEVIRVRVPEDGGVLSHWTTALGMRGRIHRRADGCDMETLVDRKGKLVVSPCRRPNHV